MVYIKLLLGHNIIKLLNSNNYKVRVISQSSIYFIFGIGQKHRLMSFKVMIFN